MQNFRNIEAWQKAHDLAIDVHKTLVKNKRVDAHLRSQLSKASRSIPACLVEGCGHDSQAELARYAAMSIGSSSEVEYWILFARDAGYFSDTDYERLTAKVIEVRRMLFGFRKSVLRNIRPDIGRSPKTHHLPDHSTPDNTRLGGSDSSDLHSVV